MPPPRECPTRPMRDGGGHTEIAAGEGIDDAGEVLQLGGERVAGELLVEGELAAIVHAASAQVGRDGGNPARARRSENGGTCPSP